MDVYQPYINRLSPVAGGRALRCKAGVRIAPVPRDLHPPFGRAPAAFLLLRHGGVGGGGFSGGAVPAACAPAARSASR